MADCRYKDLTIDNAFDFCEVLAAIGAEQVPVLVNTRLQLSYFLPVFCALFPASSVLFPKLLVAFSDF